jgi:hypothetical protein
MSAMFLTIDLDFISCTVIIILVHNPSSCSGLFSITHTTHDNGKHWDRGHLGDNDKNAAWNDEMESLIRSFYRAQ